MIVVTVAVCVVVAGAAGTAADSAATIVVVVTVARFFFTITCAKASKYEFTGIFRYCELYHIIKIEHVCASVQAWVRAFSRVYNNVLTYSIQ